MSLANLFAPRHSKRRLILKIARATLLNPRSALARLSPVNFHNARVCAAMRIYCPVCGETSGLYYDFPDIHLRKEHGIGLLRETLSCKSCGATMRDRQMALGLLKVAGARSGRNATSLQELRKHPVEGLRILDTDSFSPLNRILRGMPGYSHSQYRPDLPEQTQLADGSLNINLLAMPFADANFDIIMTSDVMEHVSEDEKAHREIFRCLAPGGMYIMTAPFDRTLAATRPLTIPTENRVGPFILERHVHGDPHSSGGIIAHRIYGNDFLPAMNHIGYDIQFKEINAPQHGVFAGDLFLAQRKV